MVTLFFYPKITTMKKIMILLLILFSVKSYCQKPTDEEVYKISTQFVKDYTNVNSSRRFDKYQNGIVKKTKNDAYLVEYHFFGQGEKFSYKCGLYWNGTHKELKYNWTLIYLEVDGYTVYSKLKNQ